MYCTRLSIPTTIVLFQGCITSLLNYYCLTTCSFYHLIPVYPVSCRIPTLDLVPSFLENRFSAIPERKSDSSAWWVSLSTICPDSLCVLSSLTTFSVLCQVSSVYFCLPVNLFVSSSFSSKVTSSVKPF